MYCIHSQYQDMQAYELLQDDYIKREMYNKKKSALDKLIQVVHAPEVNSFLTIIARSWVEEDNEAIIIAKRCLLDEDEIMASLDDFELYREYVLEREEDLYVQSQI